MKKLCVLFIIKAFLLLLFFYVPFSVLAINITERDIVLDESNNQYRIKIIRSSNTELTVKFSLNNIDFLPDVAFSGKYYANIEGFIQNHEAGKPSIPNKIISLELPVAKKCEVHLIDSSFIYFDYELTPSRPLSLEAVQLEDIPNIVPYSGYMQHGVFNFTDYQTYRFLHTHYFSCCPVNFDYQNKKIRVCNSFTAKIKYNESDIDNIFSSRNKTFQLSTKNHLGISENQDFGINVEPQDITEDYLILSLAYLDSVDVKRFAEWKKTQGFRTHIEYRNHWTTEEIDNVVKSYYFNPDLNLNYLLILSTHDNIPGVKDGFLWSNYSPGNIPSYTDINYACMDGPRDITADIYYGRVGVYTNGMIKTAVDKWIKYQKDPVMDASFYKNAFVSGYFEPSRSNVQSERDDIFRTNEIIKKYLNIQNIDVKRLYATKPELSPKYYFHYKKSPTSTFRSVLMGNDTIRYDDMIEMPKEIQRPVFTWNNDSLAIVNTFNEGCFLGSYFSHGQWFGWHSLKFRSDRPILNMLSNGEKQPLLLCVTCSNGDFYTHYSFAYEMSRRKNGCMGVIASSAPSFWEPNRYLFEGMINFIFDKPGLLSNLSAPKNNFSYNLCQLGEILQQGKRNIRSNSYSLAEILSYHVFGDPSSQFFTSVPTEFTCPSLKYDGIKLKVKPNFGETPVYISFYDHGSGKINRYLSFLEECSFIPESDSITTICLMGRNKKPYIIEFNPKTYVLDANVNPDVSIIRSVVFNPSDASLTATLNLNCSDEIKNEICDNGYTVYFSRLGEPLRQIMLENHDTHTAKAIISNPKTGIYVVYVENKSGKLLDSYKIQIVVD